MSPIRKEGDYRSVEIESWDDYIEDDIVGMQARGELDNLPDQGKPIKIWRTKINPEYDLAFSRLKNAGVMPLWMELDKEIAELTDGLWSRLDKVEAELRESLVRLQSSPELEPTQPQSLWQRLTSWFRMDLADKSPPPPTITSIKTSRDWERARFLELAAELDKKISTYHDSLPSGAEHLQRLRWIPSRAERIFNERIALAKWWEARL